MRSVTSRTLPPEWTCRLQLLQPNPVYLQPDAPPDVGDASVPCIFVHSVRLSPNAEPSKCPLSSAAQGDAGCLGRSNGACGGQGAAETIAAAQASESDHHVAEFAEFANPLRKEAESEAEAETDRSASPSNTRAMAKAEAEAEAVADTDTDSVADASDTDADYADYTKAKAVADEADEAKEWALADQRRNHRAEEAIVMAAAKERDEDAALAEAEVEAEAELAKAARSAPWSQGALQRQKAEALAELAKAEAEAVAADEWILADQRRIHGAEEAIVMAATKARDEDAAKVKAEEEAVAAEKLANKAAAESVAAGQARIQARIQASEAVAVARTRPIGEAAAAAFLSGALHSQSQRS